MPDVGEGSVDSEKECDKESGRAVGRQRCQLLFESEFPLKNIPHLNYRELYSHPHIFVNKLRLSAVNLRVEIGLHRPSQKQTATTT